MPDIARRARALGYAPVLILLSIILLALAYTTYLKNTTAATDATKDATRSASLSAAVVASLAASHLVGADVEGLKKAVDEAVVSYGIRHIHIVDESGKEIYSTQSAFSPDDATKQLLDGHSPTKPYVSTVKTAAGPVVTATAAVVGGRAGFVAVGEPVAPSPPALPAGLTLFGGLTALVASGFAARRSLRGGEEKRLYTPAGDEPIHEAEIVEDEGLGGGSLCVVGIALPLQTQGEPLAAAFQALWQRLASAVEKIRSVENDLSRTIFEVVETADALKRSVREQDERAGAAMMAFRAIEGASSRQRAIAEDAGRAVEEAVSSAYAVEAHLDSTADEVRALGKSAKDAIEFTGQIAQRAEAARANSRTLETIATQLNMIALGQAVAANSGDGSGRSWGGAAVEDMQQLAVCAGESARTLADMASFLSLRVDALRGTLSERIGGGASLVESRIERVKESCDSAAARLNQVVASLGELAELSKEARAAGEAAAKAVLGLVTVVGPSVEHVSRAALTAKETTDRTGKLLDDMRLSWSEPDVTAISGKAVFARATQV